MIQVSEIVERGYKYLTKKQLAEVLGISVPQVAKLIDALGIRKSNRWCDESDTELIKLYESGLKIALISERIGVGYEATKSRIRVLRVKGKINYRNS